MCGRGPSVFALGSGQQFFFFFTITIRVCVRYKKLMIRSVIFAYAKSSETDCLQETALRGRNQRSLAVAMWRTTERFPLNEARHGALCLGSLLPEPTEGRARTHTGSLQREHTVGFLEHSLRDLSIKSSSLWSCYTHTNTCTLAQSTTRTHSACFLMNSLRNVTIKCSSGSTSDHTHTHVVCTHAHTMHEWNQAHEC